MIVGASFTGTVYGTRVTNAGSGHKIELRISDWINSFNGKQ
ncbi:hypothetical protein WH280_17035 [Erwinia sp. MYb535]